MKSYIKNLIKKIYSLPFVWKYIGSYFRKDGVIVLMYHRIGDEQGFFPSFSVKVFEIQMRWVKKNCNVIHSDEILNGIENNVKNKPNVIITFDDGYQCCYKYAYPILKKLGLPALVFLATQPPDDGGLIWTDEIYFLINSTKVKKIKLPWDSDEIKISNDQVKNEIHLKIKSYLKSVGNKQRLEYLQKLRILFNISPESDLERQMLSWAEVRDSLNIVSYGGHTHTHPIMSKITEKELEVEIKTCRDKIFFETGMNPISFAYPNGRSDDYNELGIKILNKYGFKFAYTTIEGINDKNTQLMEIKRVPTGAKKLEDFVWLMSHGGHK